MPRKQRFKPSRKPKPALAQEDMMQVRQPSQPAEETGKSSTSMAPHGSPGERQHDIELDK
ncbi:MAG: hypothetical protein H0T89_10480 [Deltaproteobacteria bacterium]|nr:hypothetical protein [Deltaproteobacteria bacterium]MDQ3296251.1 hypothetical protein [Myxococcota bacterium]